MKLIELSTKIRPLFFFEFFIKKDKLMEYKDSFYNHPINPSQKSFKEKGYKEYMKDSYYGNEEYKPVRVYFKDDLKRLLDNQILYTTKLLIERKDKLEYQNIVADIFIKKQLKIIENLKGNIDNITVCKELVLDSLILLEKNIIKIVGNDDISIPVNFKIKTNNPFFEPKVKRNVLIKLYDIALNNNLINDESVTQTDFLNVFMSNNPKGLENKIIFSVDNQVATFFLNTIGVLFDSLSHSKISKSKSFYKKSSKVFNQADLDTAKTRYCKKPLSSELLKLKSDIDKIIPKIN